MDEVRTIQTALYERFGRPGAAVLIAGDPDDAGRLLPKGQDLEAIRAVLQPIQTTWLAARTAELAQTRNQALTHEGPSLGQGR